MKQLKAYLNQDYRSLKKGKLVHIDGYTTDGYSCLAVVIVYDYVINENREIVEAITLSMIPIEHLTIVDYPYEEELKEQSHLKKFK
ncbi:MAG: hypothetical protein AAGU18_10830 [Proteiniphilum sp.]